MGHYKQITRLITMKPTTSFLFKNNAVAVTGGLGLIGSYVCDELLIRGARVVVVDDESKGGWTYCRHLFGKVEHRKGNLEDGAFALEALAGVDVVMHLASRTCGVGFSSKNHLELLEQNNRVTSNVLAAIRVNPPEHLLVTSSSCVYSDEAATLWMIVFLGAANRSWSIADMGGPSDSLNKCPR